MRGRDGRIWVGLFKPRNPAADSLAERPFLRKVLLRLPRSLLPLGEVLRARLRHRRGRPRHRATCRTRAAPIPRPRAPPRPRTASTSTACMRTGSAGCRDEARARCHRGDRPSGLLIGVAARALGAVRCQSPATSSAEPSASGRPRGGHLHPAQHPRAAARRPPAGAPRREPASRPSRPTPSASSRSGASRSQPEDGKVVDAKQTRVAELRACFGPTGEPHAAELLCRDQAGRDLLSRQRRVPRAQDRLPGNRPLPGPLPARAERTAGAVCRRAADDEYDDQQGRLRRRHRSARLHPGLDRHDPPVEIQVAYGRSGVGLHFSLSAVG